MVKKKIIKIKVIYLRSRIPFVFFMAEIKNTIQKYDTIKYKLTLKNTKGENLIIRKFKLISQEILMVNYCFSK